MKTLILTQKGSAKKQLQKVLKDKTEDDQELEDYVKEGRGYLKELDDKVAALQAMQKGLEQGKTIAQIDLETSKSKTDATKKQEVQKIKDSLNMDKDLNKADHSSLIAKSEVKKEETIKKVDAEKKISESKE